MDQIAAGQIFFGFFGALLSARSLKKSIFVQFVLIFCPLRCLLITFWERNCDKEGAFGGQAGAQEK